MTRNKNKPSNLWIRGLDNIYLVSSSFQWDSQLSLARKRQFQKTPSSTRVLQGKPLSFQNLVAADAAVEAAKQMKEDPKGVHSFHSQNPHLEMQVDVAAQLGRASPLAFPKQQSNAVAAAAAASLSAAV